MASILNVDQINNATGTTALKIDSDGVVYNPQKPFVSVQFDGTLAYLSHSAGDAIKFSAVHSGDATLYNTTTYKFTCPVDGIYLATYQLLIASAAAYGIELVKNSTQIDLGFTTSRINSSTNVVSCSAGDEIYWVSTTAQSYYQGTGVARYSWGSYALIG